jgi:hypothetical protein
MSPFLSAVQQQVLSLPGITIDLNTSILYPDHRSGSGGSWEELPQVPLQAVMYNLGHSAIRRAGNRKEEKYAGT